MFVHDNENCAADTISFAPEMSMGSWAVHNLMHGIFPHEHLHFHLWNFHFHAWKFSFSYLEISFSCMKPFVRASNKSDYFHAAGEVRDILMRLV